jgi:hypothetical protein
MYVRCALLTILLALPVFSQTQQSAPGDASAMPRLSKVQQHVFVAPPSRVSPDAPDNSACLQNMRCYCDFFKPDGSGCAGSEYCKRDGQSTDGFGCGYDVYDPNRCFTFDDLDCGCPGSCA